MSIQIANSGSTIKITQNGGSFYIPKPYLVDFVPTVTQPAKGVRPGVITIKYPDGDDTKNFSFKWSDVLSPVAANIQALVDAIEAFQDTGIGEDVNITGPLGQQVMAASIPVAIASDQSAVQVKGNIKVSSLTLTRPADATAYAAKDVVNDSVGSPTIMQFANVVPVAGNTGYLVKARLLTSQSTNVARYRLHLYNVAPTAIADNSPFTLLATNADKRIGYIDFPSCQTEGTGSTAANTMFTLGTLNNLTIQSPQGAIPFLSVQTKLFGILETLDGFVPDNAQTFFIELTSDVNGL